MNRLALLLLLPTLITRAHAGELRVGVASEVITPPPGTPLAGYYSTRLSAGVDDDLYAKAVVIERDGVKVALVACDLITMPRGVTEDARKLIATAPGIPPERVMLSATHTHTGPIVIRGSSQDPAEGEVATRSQSYTKSLPELIARAVRKADSKLAPAKVSAGVGHKEGLSFNRRYFMKDGKLGWNPGKLNPKIDKPAGPIDPDVAVLSFEAAGPGGKPLATYVNFAMHPDTIGSERISGDYPGALAASLAKTRGADVLTVFANGACGDINHINVNSAERQEGLAEARRIGDELAAEVTKTLGALQPVPDGPLRARHELVALPLPEVTPEEVEAAREVVLKPSKARMAIDRVRAFKVLDVAARKGTALDGEVQVIALGGDVAWVALPGEIFVELGLEIKRRSPFKRTIIVELANGSLGYIPTKRAFAEGNYEPTSARVAPGSGEMLVEAAVRLLGELHAAK